MPETAVSTARLTITVSDSIPRESGFGFRIRKGLSTTLVAAAWRLNLIGIGVGVVVPRLVLLWTGVKVVVRLRKKPAESPGSRARLSGIRKLALGLAALAVIGTLALRSESPVRKRTAPRAVPPPAEADAPPLENRHRTRDETPARTGVEPPSDDPVVVCDWLLGLPEPEFEGLFRSGRLREILRNLLGRMDRQEIPRFLERINARTRVRSRSLKGDCI